MLISQSRSEKLGPEREDLRSVVNPAPANGVHLPQAVKEHHGLPIDRFINRARRWMPALILAAAGFLLAGCRPGSVEKSSGKNSRIVESREGVPAPQAGEYHGAVVTDPLPKPDFTLNDTSGSPFKIRERTEGFVTLLFFGFANCADVCPLHMATVAHALRKVPADVSGRVKVIFVTTDPERDTPPRLRAWLDEFDTGFVGLTGTRQEIDRAQASTGLPLATRADLGGGDYGMNHAAFIIAYTADNLARLVYPLGVSQEDWEQDLSRLVREE